MAHAPQHAPVAKPVHYERRRPEKTTLYRLLQEHFETFLAQVTAHTGASLPEFVKGEFDAFLECGVLAHGFLRLRCAECTREEARADIFDYIKVFYNRKRRHGYLGNISPVDFEERSARSLTIVH